MKTLLADDDVMNFAGRLDIGTTVSLTAFVGDSGVCIASVDFEHAVGGLIVQALICA